MSGTRYKIDEPELLAEHGSRLVTDVGGIEVAVFNIHGEMHAIPNRCPHVGGPLGNGALTGYTDVSDDDTIVYDDTENIVECPWHCWRFDVTTGENIDDSRYKVPTFEVEADDGDLFVVV